MKYGCVSDSETHNLASEEKEYPHGIMIQTFLVIQSVSRDY